MSLGAHGYITWKGDLGRPGGGNVLRTKVPFAQYEKMEDFTLQNALKAHTKCIVQRATLNYYFGNTFVSPPGLDANVDERVTIYMRDVTPGQTEGSIVSLTLPAPVDGDLEKTTNGIRLTDAAITSIMAAINEASSHTYLHIGDSYEGKR
jgi:hypothetical protein